MDLFENDFPYILSKYANIWLQPLPCGLIRVTMKGSDNTWNLLLKEVSLVHPNDLSTYLLCTVLELGNYFTKYENCFNRLKKNINLVDTFLTNSNSPNNINENK